MWIVLADSIILSNLRKCENMLVVGTVSSLEEQNELRFIAEIVIIGERFRFLGRQHQSR